MFTCGDLEITIDFAIDFALQRGKAYVYQDIVTKLYTVVDYPIHGTRSAIRYDWIEYFTRDALKRKFTWRFTNV